MKNSFKRVMAVALSAAMVLTAAPLASVNSNAATKVKLSATKGTIKVGKTKKVTIKGLKKSNIKSVKFTYSNTKKRVTVKRSGLTIKITGKKKGTVTVTATIKLKKAVNKKKTYKLKYKATVKKATTTPTVVKTESITLDQATATVMEGSTITLKATTTPADANEAVEWTSDKPEVATVAAGVVTGVKEGTATITVKSGEASASCIVTVTKKEVVATLTDAKQTKSDEIQATFDIPEAKSLVNKDDLVIERVDGLGVIPANKIEWSEDGKVATVTLSSHFVDKVDYQVSYKGGTAIGFTASVGAVSSIVIKTVSVEQNVKTKIDFALLDAAGIDVTAAANIDSEVDVTVEPVDGSSVTSDLTKPSTAAITMTVVGEKAKVIVKYTAQNATTTVTPAEAIVTCTAPTATVGDARFKLGTTSGTKLWGDGSECAKFYVGADDTKVSVSVGQTKDYLYFCAADKKTKEIISYDSYEISSSNDDYMSASVADSIDTGKYAKISVTGNKEGTANVLVKAIKNGADYTYSIPVVITKEAVLASITVSVDRSTMSNAVDEDYYGQIKVKGKDTNGDDITGFDYSTELLDADKFGNKTATVKVNGRDYDLADEFNCDGFDVNGNIYTADGAVARKYTIKVTADTEAGKTVEGRATVDVKALATGAWALAGNSGAKMEYSMEFTNGSKLDVAGTTTETTAKLAAYTGKNFAGYVRGTNGIIGTGGNYGAILTPGVKAETSVTSGIVFTAKESGSYLNFYKFTTQTIADEELATWTNVDGTTDVFVGTENTKVDLKSALDGWSLEIKAPATTAKVEVTKNTGSATGAIVITPKTGKVSQADINAQFASYDGTNKGTAKLANNEINAIRALNANDDFTGTARAAADVTDYVPAKVAGVKYVANPDFDDDADVDATNFWGTVVYTYDPVAVTDLDTAAADYAAKATKVAAEFEVTAFGTALGTTAATTNGVTEVTSVGTGSVTADTATEIRNIRYGVKFGSKYSATGLLTDQKNGEWWVSSKDDCVMRGWNVTLYSIDYDYPAVLYVGKTDADKRFAKTGTYTVCFFFEQGTKNDKKEATSPVTVANGYVTPKVSVTKRVVDGFDPESIREALSIDVDMNNNTSSAASFTGDLLDSKLDVATSDGSKMTIAYVAVDDQDITFVIPVSATFKTE